MENLNKIAEDLKETSASNLREMKKSGVVKTVKIYGFPGRGSCKNCRDRDGMILGINEGEIGTSLPPFSDCEDINNPKILRCRCYWRPWDISID